MIDLDSSAIVKLVRREPETPALVAWLKERHAEPKVSSCLAEVEVVRALRRYDADALVGVPAVLARLYRIEMDARIRAMAAAYEDPLLWTSDAIHLATAEMLLQEGQALGALVAYDDRLLAAAHRRGLPVPKPGSDGEPCNGRSLGAPQGACPF
jgi:predicted nucleic acid-binding protein